MGNVVGKDFKYYKFDDGGKAQAMVILNPDMTPITFAGGDLTSDTFTQTLNAGDNTVNHNLDKTIIGFWVKNQAGAFQSVSGNIIDSDNFNINLAGGSIANAAIVLVYNA